MSRVHVLEVSVDSCGLSLRFTRQMMSVSEVGCPAAIELKINSIHFD